MFTWVAAAALLPQFSSLDLVVDPSEHASPRGTYVLEIDPTARDGTGPARYHLRRGGETAWRDELAFTLTEVAVLESGHVVGYSELRRGSFLKGDFVVAVVAPDGELVLEERTESTNSLYIHMPDNPNARGLVLDPDHDGFAVRVADPDVNRGYESWWRYRISTGERREDLVPASRMKNPKGTRNWLESGDPLAGTDLVLLHWLARGYPADGAVFTLVRGEDATVVWRLDLPRDYTVEGDEEADDALFERVRELGAVLATGPNGRFELWHVRDGQRVVYRAVADAGVEQGWRVEEFAREDHAPPEPESVPTEPELPQLPLVRLEDAVLETTTDPTATLGDVRAWGFDGEGGIRLIRRNEEGAFAEVHLGPEGAVLDERPFHDDRRGDLDGMVQWTDTGAGSWLVVQKRYGDEGSLHVHRAVTDTGTVAPLEDFEAPRAQDVLLSPNKLAPGPGAGFLLLGNFHFKYTLSSALFAFDERGAVRWAVHEDYSDPSKLSSPESVVVTTDGRVAVLENVHNVLRVYDTDGAHLHTAELEDVWGVKPSYLSNVTSAPGGDLLIYDFNGDPPLWHVDVRGVPHRSLTPHFSDGRAPRDLAREARFAPDGTLWTFDGYGFLRLDEEGLVVGRVGHEAVSYTHLTLPTIYSV